ncbi:MAG: hypothetical protein GQ574_28830 [Crocinitomix sp.]|nr:hypothetical protein [Crocinitomix sp.]
MRNSDKNIGNEFENEFEKSLRSLGYLFPCSDDEVDFFEDNFEIEAVPDHFPKAVEIIRKPKRTLNLTHNKDETKWSENLGRVARNGKGFSPEVLKKMKEDRDNAEKGDE